MLCGIAIDNGGFYIYPSIINGGIPWIEIYCVMLSFDQHHDLLPAPLVPRAPYVNHAELTHTKQIVIIMGLRRCGKSVLMQFIRSQLRKKTIILILMTIGSCSLIWQISGDV